MSNAAFIMNPTRPLIVGLAITVCALTACTDRVAQQESTRQKSEAKARAEASRKEMEKLPETFKPRYNKKLTPEAAPSTGEAGKKAAEPPVK